jgi:predicted nicotinamide N-methyase
MTGRHPPTGKSGAATGQSGAATGQSAPEIVRAGATLRPVSLVPEILLYQAAEPMSVWQLTEEATGRICVDPPFWAFAWAGGQALARYLLDHPETVAARNVIDIASGSGLVAIAAAMAGAATVTAYDIDPLAAAAITLNAKANSVAIRAVCADVLGDEPNDPLPPGGTDPIDHALPRDSTGLSDDASPQDGTGPVADSSPQDGTGLSDDASPQDGTGLGADSSPLDGTGLVLVADAFYERDLAGQALRFAERARARGAAVLLGDLGRAYLPRARLTPLASYDVPDLASLEDRDTKRTTVWTLRFP